MRKKPSIGTVCGGFMQLTVLELVLCCDQERNVKGGKIMELNELMLLILNYNNHF